jgi:PDZ domain-containing protein
MAVDDGAPLPLVNTSVSDSGAAPPPLPPPSPPPAPTFPRWGWWAIGVSAVVSIVVIAGFVIHVPYGTISPGEAVSLRPIVHVDGAAAHPDDRGDLRLLFVRERNHVNLWRYLQAKLDSDIDLYPESVLTGGLPVRDANAYAQSDMVKAKIAATKIALEAAGFTVPSPRGVVVTATLPGRPAEKVLKAGDAIVSADGKPVIRGEQLTEAISKRGVGSKVELGIVRNGKSQTVMVPIALEKCQKPVQRGCVDRPAIGVLPFSRYPFPVKINIETENIGGPSAGLAMTLAILDDLTPGNLTGGKRVAVTGTIDTDGNVGEIGGINQKAVAARAAGARVFIVPQCQTTDAPRDHARCQKDLSRAIQRAGSKVKVVPVSTFEQALNVLRAAGGDAVVAQTPTTRAA